jgi:hypothetical protein
MVDIPASTAHPKTLILSECGAGVKPHSPAPQAQLLLAGIPWKRTV